MLTHSNGLDLGGEVPRPLSRLTDFEEMLVARIHPLIQVFTLFPSGQTAYVGHVVNFRQHSIRWVQNLPLHPDDIPIILVRRKTREAAGTRARRSPFAARKEVLRDAVLWLLADHPQWQPGVHGDTQLCEENLQEYEDGGGQVDVTCQEVDNVDALDISRDLFAHWVDNASFKYASAMRACLSPSDSATGCDCWDLLRKQLVQMTGAERHRAAETIPVDLVSAFLADHGNQT